MLDEIRYALRGFIKSSGFTVLAVLTLALGIAGSAVIFSVFNGLFLRPLPFKDPEQLVNLDEVAPKWNLEYTGVAYINFNEWRAENRTFESMAVWQDNSFNLSLKGNPERIEGGRVSHDLLRTLGIQPLIGRGFTQEEDRLGADRVALIGHGLWKRLWGGESNVLGQTLSLDSVPATIIGVLPLSIGPLSQAEVLIPLRLNVNDANGWYLEGVGRLKPGITSEAALQDLTRIHKAMIPNRPVNEITSPRLTPLRQRLLGDYRSGTYILLAAVGVVWLIACANVAGLMLARGLGRAKEISIRMALGATRSSVVRQVLVESLLLASMAGLLGICLGQSSLGALTRLLPEQFPNWIHFGMDGRFVLFCLVTTAATGGIFGLIPAVQMVSNVNLHGALQATTSKSTGSSRQRRSLNALVVGEIALALVLLINAGLLLQAFRALQKVDPGFRSENVLTYDLSLPRAAYTNTQQVAFFEEHLDRVRALPGVKAASATTMVPLGGHSGTFFTVENALPRAKDEQDPVVLQRHVFPSYAEAMGLTVLSGRFFSDQETRGAGVNAVQVRTMAERVRSSLWLRRSYSWLFGFFAAVALTMALAGVYGVISYAVSQRTNEIGIRMALGAQRLDVLRLVLRHGLILAGAGTVIGLLGAFVLSHSMRTLLFGVNAIEPVTLLVVPLLLLAVVLIACLLPARKATRVEPMVALRYE